MVQRTCHSDLRCDHGFKSALGRKLDELAALRAGWDGYGAPPIDPAVIRAARTLVDRLPDHLESGPEIVPMSAGNLQLEWHDGPRVLELEFETPETIHFLKWDPTAGIEEEDCFPATDLTTTVQLIHWLNKSL